MENLYLDNNHILLQCRWGVCRREFMLMRILKQNPLFRQAGCNLMLHPVFIFFLFSRIHAMVRLTKYI